MKRIAALFLVLLMLCPAGGAAAREMDVSRFCRITFDEPDDLALFSDNAVLADGYSEKCLAVSGGDPVYADIQRLDSNLRVGQTVRASAMEEGSIRLQADGADVIRVCVYRGDIRVLHKDGWTQILSGEGNIWYKIGIVANLKSGNFFVTVDDVKLGRDFTILNNPGFVNRLSYDIKGGSDVKFYVDDLYVTSAVLGGDGTESGVTDRRTLGVPEMKKLPEDYKVPEEGVDGTHLLGNEPISASSTDPTGDYGIENILKKDNSIWKAERPSPPTGFENGKSLRITKPEAGGGTVLAEYSFTPVSGTLILEQDILTTDNFHDKGTPYFIDASGNNVVSALFHERDYITTGGAESLRTLISEFNIEQWYRIRFELDTATQTAAIYVNGELAGTSAFRTNARSIAKVQWHIAANHQGTFFVDNLRLATKTPLGNEIVLMEEDFEKYAIGSNTFEGWKTNMGNGSVGVEEYVYHPFEGKYPQTIFLDMTREGRLEQVNLTFPENTNYKFDVAISRDNIYFVRVADRSYKYCSGQTHLAFGPVGARWIRIRIYDGVDDAGNNIAAQIQNLDAVWQRRTPDSNLAFQASLEVSSSNSSLYDQRGLTDGLVAEFGNIGEWEAADGDASPTVKLSWTEPQTVDRIILHDRANLECNLRSGRLEFSDGSAMEVTDIPASGAPKDLRFDPKTISWVSFTVKEYEGDHPGLSEFQVFRAGANPELPEYIEPWKIVKINPEVAGTTVLAADLDNDGEVELVTGRCVVETGGQHYYDHHELVCCGAQKLDGTVLWQWGTPRAGQRDPGADSPICIYDLDNDGNKEVLVANRSYLYILNGRTGEELQKFKLPTPPDYPADWACDRIDIVNVSGNDYPSDIMVKTRYTDVWVFTKDWEQIWHVSKLDDCRTSHQAWALDIDNDGCDEILEGYHCIETDGSVKWAMDPKEYRSRMVVGHQDSIKPIVFDLIGDVNKDWYINQRDLDLLQEALAGKTVLSQEAARCADTDGDGKVTEKDAVLLRQRVNHEIRTFPNKGLDPKDMRFCLCFCGGYDVVTIDGNGKRVWGAEDNLHHETIMTGDFLAEHPGIEILTNPTFMEVDTVGNNGIYLFAPEDGKVLGCRYGYQFNRYVWPINWGAEQDYFVLGTDNVILDGHYQLKVKPLSPTRFFRTPMSTMPVGDVRYDCDIDGDGTRDLVMQVEGAGEYDETWYIYQNKNGKVTADDIGIGHNYSFY